MKYILFLILIICSSLFAAGQDSSVYKAFQKHLKLAKQYNEAALYAECIEEATLAHQIAKESNWTKLSVESGIFLAESQRKTGDFAEGLTVLKKLNSSINYPELHIRKLGRIAAMLNGLAAELTNQYEYRDSVLFYLDSALNLASTHQFRELQAGLFNELGYTLGATNIDSSLFYLNKAVNLFRELKDTANYVVAKTNLMRSYIKKRDLPKANTIIEEVIALTQSDNFKSLGVKLEFYRTLTYYYNVIEDSLKYNYWSVKKYKTISEVLVNSNSNKLNSFRVLFETKKYQEESAQKELLLEKEAKRRNELIVYFTILIIVSLIVGFLLIRERKLKKAVNRANEKYHMLLVESNHRIKNNLQMIISMLQYANKDMKDEDTSAFKRMSGKIYTISALHKHLYLDVHNELVNINTYFGEILTLYEDLSSSQYQIEMKVDNVMIESERLVYFGLILNELLSNTFEHGNAVTKKMTIKVGEKEDYLYFHYQDNSIFNGNAQMGKGMELIKQLVNRVGGRNFKVDGAIGLYQFEFYV